MISVLCDRSVDQPIVVAVADEDKIEGLLTDYINLLNSEGHNIDVNSRKVLVKRDNFVTYGYRLRESDFDDPTYFFSISTHNPNKIDSIEMC